MLALSLPATDLKALRARIQRTALERPGTYRMLGADGRVLYAGKAKSLRTRLLSYFRAQYPNDKQARILHAARDIAFDYAPSEFAAMLAELSVIRKYRPPLNVAMNRSRRHAFLVLTDESAPRLIATTSPERLGGRIYGPIPSPARAQEAVRILSDLLGLRDCRATMPVRFGGQTDCFVATARSPAGCSRHEFGTCLGPCAGLVSEAQYRDRAEMAAAFCEGSGIAPIDRIVREMSDRAGRDDFEGALRWRERFEALEWLLAATTRARAAIELLSFTYRQPGAHGDDRIYLIRSGEVRACFPDPVTPLEREMFAGVVRDECDKPSAPLHRVDAERLHQRVLVMSWFRSHPDAWRRTTPLN